MAEDEELQNQEQAPSHIKFKYIKSGLFRVIHVDGIWAAITPNSDINISFCSERRPIPKEVVYKINSDGTLGEEVLPERQELAAIVREVDVSAVMKVEVAKELIELLQYLVRVAEGEEDEENGQE